MPKKALRQVKPLVKYDNYTREDVMGIFAPHTDFVPQRGLWGARGLIRIPEHTGDFVFFVTYGKKQGSHTFEESVTTDGILTWQSEPGQKLSHLRIQQLIKHNHLENDVYLFLRTSRDLPYTYLGRLAYRKHDPETEEPVHFEWQILDWELPSEKIREMQIQLVEREQGDYSGLPEELIEEAHFFEGAKRQITVNAYERNTVARSKCIEYYGAKCMVCSFVFSDKYGIAGTGFIHVHHIKPLSVIEEKYSVDPIRDLRPVCPNCHAIIHKRRPPYEIEEVRRLIEQAEPKSNDVVKKA